MTARTRATDRPAQSMGYLPACPGLLGAEPGSIDGVFAHHRSRQIFGGYSVWPRDFYGCSLSEVLHPTFGERVVSSALVPESASYVRKEPVLPDTDGTKEE